MSQDTLPEDPWGLLVSLDEDSEKRFPIIRPEFKIGRNKDCDIAILNNKHVSSCHCSIIKDEEGVIWCKDTSTNGTLVNGVKINKEQVRLCDSQIIRIVFRKGSSNMNVSYKFVNLCPSDSTASLDATQEYLNTLETDKESSPINTKTKCSTPPPIEVNEEKKAAVTDSGDPPKLELNKKDSIEETLLCQICQEILHDCVSLQPCTHTYCAGCYSDWMSYSNECPSCRLKVERITKNFIVNNLVSAYLRSNPGKKRPEEDLKELDEKNKIDKDMMLPKAKRRKRLSWDEEESEDYSDDDDEDDDDISSSSGPDPLTIALGRFESEFRDLESSVIALKSRSAMSVKSCFVPPTKCRQCPSYAGPSHAVSTRSSFTCSPSTNHVLCMCCMLPMPDRRSESDLSIPPQKCDICSKSFCHMYWGCGCTAGGCLNQFKDVTYDESTLGRIINDNSYESKVLKDYLREKGLAFKDMINTCLDKLDNGTYSAPDTRSARISSCSRTCFACALKNMKDLAFQYRSDISSEELPDSVTDRPNCHWGRQCRTQVHNTGHAKTYNHICPQTRF
ncbi:PREDICTED: E3 ubiquitin-protein ligase CHFR-like [Amphimedon queenslandica]|uniref:E3 ubiquitin-protein ligase CHFR n=1 Tax=Amphimedon queenslandica TaxID=400682 RepID=A0A1X7UEF5_AMPQE|nr:PREDICTED: E3 ubiquitin-protein ligase CHFR-like [Amphimedon queenslandica]|eukprot:XP_019854831.1 PREDICTED: E3 ubiquitin-protein ligase CHFR-like [Amphimedon queenslandica]